MNIKGETTRMIYPDFLELLRVLEKHKVSYAVIGGYAVGMYAEPDRGSETESDYKKATK